MAVGTTSRTGTPATVLSFTVTGNIFNNSSRCLACETSNPARRCSLGCGTPAPLVSGRLSQAFASGLSPCGSGTTLCIRTVPSASVTAWFAVIFTAGFSCATATNPIDNIATATQRIIGPASTNHYRRLPPDHTRHFYGKVMLRPYLPTMPFAETLLGSIQARFSSPNLWAY